MFVSLSKKDKLVWYKVISGICGNLAAGWFGLILIVPGFSLPDSFDKFLVLTKSIALGILFMWLSFKLERISR